MPLKTNFPIKIEEFSLLIFLNAFSPFFLSHEELIGKLHF